MDRTLNQKLKLLKMLSKKANLTILLSLKDGPKKWSDLITFIYPRDLHKGLKELLNNGLIEITVRFDTPTGSKAYQLSPLGRKIVKHLEEMEKDFKNWHEIPYGKEFLEWRDEFKEDD